MRDDLTIAVGELYQAIRHEHWQGKTYRQFWTWFNDRCIQIVGMADQGHFSFERGRHLRMLRQGTA